LHGGILEYGRINGNAHWEGRCVVFDSRGAVNLDAAHDDEIEICGRCLIPTDNLNKCIECKENYLTCKECISVFGEYCSKNCKQTS